MTEPTLINNSLKFLSIKELTFCFRITGLQLNIQIHNLKTTVSYTNRCEKIDVSLIWNIGHMTKNDRKSQRI